MIKQNYYEKDLILIGAGGHAKVIIDTIKTYHKDYNIIGVTDENIEKRNKLLCSIPIIGKDDILIDLYSRGVRNAFITLGTVGNYLPRSTLYNKVKELGFDLINIIHGSCIMSSNISLGQGNALLAGTIINAEAHIGDNCIINTGSIIEHECYLGNNIHIAPGVKISGQVKISDNCMIGIGTSIIQGISIGRNSIVGAGSVVINDIPENSIAIGAPAKVIKKRL